MPTRGTSVNRKRASRTSVWCLGITTGVLAAGVAALSAQPLGDDGTYTSAQATSGKTAYDQACAECHADDLGGGIGPALAGPSFTTGWSDRTSGELLTVIENGMPPGGSDTLTGLDYLDIVAYVLQVNGHPAGARELHAARPVVIGAGGDAEAPRPAGVGHAGLPPNREVPDPTSWREIERYSLVTDDLLANPPPGDWLSWRRTLDGHGYSPLTQITRENIGELRLAWSCGMTGSSNQGTPLVHDGVMFLANPGGPIQALDAGTGEIIWEFTPEGRGVRARTIAMYADKIVAATGDASIIALDVRTGELAWESAKAERRSGYSQSAGPIVAAGVVISGIGGCGRYKEAGCFVTGHDAETGDELWRTSTVALPGDPNDASSTWGTVPVERRWGTETWIPRSFDPEINLFYIGTAQAKPWMAFNRGMRVSDAALYSNSTLALDPRSGEMAWYYQHVPGESLDLDTVFERVLIDIDDEQLLFTVGKDGLLWKLDRRDGSFRGVTETVFQNVYSIDRTTGTLTYRPDIVEAQPEEWVAACPSYWGGHNWIASAYSPETEALVVPLHQSCFEMKGPAVDLETGGGMADVRFFEMPGTDGNLGRLTAFDVRTMEPLWTHQQRAMLSTGALTTAGGLVFVGDMDRWFKAFDVTTGELVWQVRLGEGTHGYPITYTAGGKQYLAVQTGVGLFLQPTRLLTPEIYAPNTGSALYVFELPDRS